MGTSSTSAETAAQTALAAANAVAKVSVKPQEFSETYAAGWYENIEAQFELAGIVNPITKFYHVVSALRAKTVDEFGHITHAKVDANSYQKLKDEIIRAYSESKTKRLNMVLDTEQIGDRSPSRFYRFLKSKISDLKVDDDLLFNRWVGKLPLAIQTTIAGLKSKLTIDEMLEHADMIHEIIGANKSVASIGNSRENNDKRSQNRSRSRGRSNSKSRNQKQKEPRKKSEYKGDGYCWYHLTFGKRAQKCHGGDCLAKKFSENDKQ